VAQKKLKLVIKEPVSIREKVYTAIRNLILDGTFPDGERLVESRIAEQIKTSRTPVREALHLLEKEGLLESIPRAGYQVKPLLWEEVEEICEIRIANETLAAKWAMKRITPKELKALENNLVTAEHEAMQGDRKTFVHRDAEFHEILARASGSERLFELCELLRKHMLRYRVQGLYLPESALRAINGHRQILASLRAGDEKRLEHAIREHLEWAMTDVHQHAFRKAGEDGAVSGYENA
jgi:GntR family transcriptional regulator, rspAB operon transcriptional repressor